jgi:density-regulated protein DRP1
MALVSDTNNHGLLPIREVIYCGACGMPPEYCEYGPDFETHCDPWLRKHHPELRKELLEKRGASSGTKKQHGEIGDSTEIDTSKLKPSAARQKPSQPWTTQERLTAFYELYVPEKVDSIPSLLEKYAGKEEKLFDALSKKYGPEPKDPYFSDSDSDDDGDDDDGGDDKLDHDDDGGELQQQASTSGSKSKRRGASAKQTGEPGVFTGKVLVQKQAQKKKRTLTVVTGLEPALAVNQHKLKDASKAFSKRFAGSSSVKDGTIILQGDHVLELAEMIVDKFQVPEECVYVDMGDGNAVPLR